MQQRGLSKFCAPALWCLVAGVCVLYSPVSTSQPAEHWSATSRTAESTTGDITFSPDKIVFKNGKFLPLAFLRHVSGFKTWMSDFGVTEKNARVEADIYRVTPPADPILINGNHICGSKDSPEPVTYIAVWHPEPLQEEIPRDMDAYSGKEPPSADKGGDVCASFVYEVGR